MTAHVVVGKRIFGETGWVFTGQLISALGTMVGLRLVTEVVPPGIFGKVALIIGVVVLAHGAVAGPLMQGVLRLYPDHAAAKESQSLRMAAVRSLRVPVVIVFGILLATLSAWSWLATGGLMLGAVSAALFVVEVMRSFEVTFLNAARNQRAMALLVVADAWARPTGAVVMVLLAGISAEAVITGYLLGSIVSLALFYILRGPSNAAPAVEGIPTVEKRLWTYAKPLMPIPLVGWVSGQADRYLLAILAGLQPAGIYAAIYGLVSRPFLMIATGFELALRQVYYGHVSAGNRTDERHIFRLWLAAVLGTSLVLSIFIGLFHRYIAALLLAEEYRAYSSLMIWIAAGYVLVATMQVVERVCYALHDTRGVLLVETAGAVLSVVVAWPMIRSFGIEGAAWAVPIYFGLQLLLTTSRARRALRGSSSDAEAKRIPCASEATHS